MSDEDKNYVREHLPSLLCDLDSRVRSQIASALCDIGKLEWPEVWPTFADGLRGCIEKVGGMSPVYDGSCPENEYLSAWLAADGALVCLDGLVGVANVEVIPELVQQLLPTLINIATQEVNSVFHRSIRGKILEIVRKLLESLSVLTDEKESRATVKSILDVAMGPILNCIASALNTPHWTQTGLYIKCAALQLSTTLIFHFPSSSILQAALPALFSSLLSPGQLGHQILLRYILVEVDGNEADDDSTQFSGTLDTHVNLHTLTGFDTITYLLSSLLSLIGAISSDMAKKKVRDQFAPHLLNAVAIVLASAQISESLLEEWGSEPDAYIRDEADDSVDTNIRQEAKEMLLDFSLADWNTEKKEKGKSKTPVVQAADGIGGSGVHAVTAGIAALLALASHPANSAAMPPSAHPAVNTMLPLLAGLQSKQEEHRWKTVESALFAFGAVHSSFLSQEKQEAQPNPKKKSRGVRYAPLALSSGHLCEELVKLIHSGGTGLIPDSFRAEKAPYLLGRALSTASKFASHSSPEAVHTLLAAGVQGLETSMALPVRLAACHSVARLFRLASKEVQQSSAAHILPRVLALITPGADDSVLQYSVGLLIRTILYAPEVAAQLETQITPTLLTLWQAKARDPFHAPTIVSGLIAMARIDNTACARAVASRLLPGIAGILGNELQATSAAQAGNSEADLDSVLNSAIVSASLTLLKAIILKEKSLAMGNRNQAASTADSPSPSHAEHFAYAALPAELPQCLTLTLQLLLISEESDSIDQGCLTLTCALDTYGPALVNSEASPIPLKPLFSATERLLSTSSNIGGECISVGPLCVALFRHIMPNLPREHSIQLIQMMAHKLALSNSLPAMTRITIALAYAIVADQDTSGNNFLGYLCQLQVPTATSGRLTFIPDANTTATGQAAPLVSAIAVWAKSVSFIVHLATDIRVKRMVFAAGLKVLGHRNALEQLHGHNTEGELIQDAKNDSKTRVTRSKSKKSQVSLSTRLAFKMLLLWLDECRLLVREEEAGEETDSDADSEEESEGTERRTGPSPFVEASELGLDSDEDDLHDDELDLLQLHNLLDSAKGFTKNMSLEEFLLAGGFNEDGFDDDEDDEDDDDMDHFEDDGENEGRESGIPSIGTDPVIHTLTSNTVCQGGKTFFGNLIAAAGNNDALAAQIARSLETQVNPKDRNDFLQFLK